MSGLLREIERIDKPAADELKKAGLQSDSDIQFLTKDDLRDLLPGPQNIKRRRVIFDTIHKQPIDQILKKLKGFIPEASLTAALTNKGVLVEYLGLLMDMKTQMDKVLNVINAHINFLNEYRPNPSDHEPVSSEPRELQPDPMETSPGESPESGSHPSPPPSDGCEDSQIPQSEGRSQAAAEFSAGSATSYSDRGVECNESYGLDNISQHSSPPSGSFDNGDGWESQSTGQQYQKQSRTNPSCYRQNSQSKTSQQAAATSYRMVVGGKTFGNHLKLMEKIKKKVHNQLREDADNHSVTFVFCPISSRVASDVEAVMSDVKDNKPVILVLMHHTHQVKATSTMKTWEVLAKVLLHVNVFYHETCGLLPCDENDAAVTEIGNKLLERFIPKSSHTSGNAESGGAEGGGTGQQHSWSNKLQCWSRGVKDRTSNFRVWGGVDDPANGGREGGGAPDTSV